MSAREKNDTEWLTVGASVASITSARGERQSVRHSKVARIGKRDVVLENGERFHVRNLIRTEGDSWSGRATVLMAGDDPFVASALAEIRQRNTERRARAACADFAHGGSVQGTTLTAADVILALAPMTGVEDQIRALFGGAA